VDEQKSECQGDIETVPNIYMTQSAMSSLHHQTMLNINM
jgi:hypothetical protein